ncbi:hypothetical protein SDC9_79539 [bioreactor metagenome]|uniref:Uncharacterized protein n=1 Tax=bioreactor metagenome TaxID=1076179 RepID=A0A644YWX5_9ZZZZ
MPVVIQNEQIAAQSCHADLCVTRRKRVALPPHAGMTVVERVEVERNREAKIRLRLAVGHAGKKRLPRGQIRFRVRFC